MGAPARSSQATKAMASRNPATSAAATSGLVQPAMLPRMSPHTTPRAAPVTRATPGRSRAAPGPKLSGMRLRTSAMAMRPIGILIQKIHCQAMLSATAPPTTGPAMRASPVKPLKTPSALPRSCGGDAAPQSALASGITHAPPPSHALDGTRGNQKARAPRQRAGGRRRHEQGEAGDEGAPAAETVAERGAGQQQHRKAQVVSVHCPLQRFDRGAEVETDGAEGGRN